jgi:hypothetical protein
VNVPDVVNVRLKDAPGAMAPESHAPPSPVLVCAVESLLVHVRVSPTEMLSGFGANAASVNVDAPRTIDTLIELPPLGCDGPAGELYDDEQPAVIATDRTRIQKKMGRTRMICNLLRK